MEVGNQGLRRELKGTKAEEEKKRFRGDIKGAESAKEQHKIMRGKQKMRGGGGKG